MSTAALGRVPFLPAETLQAHQVYEPLDGRFRAAARMRQALLREENGWPIGQWPADGDKQRPLGSYLAPEHGDANFVTPEVAALVRREIAYREDDALIDQDRLYRNMLSSMPATFSLVGPLKLRARLATAVLRRIQPGFIQKVTDVLFEHSPARRHPAFTMDRTAFDVLIKVDTTAGVSGFVAVEVKFTETGSETPARLRPRYDELSTQSGLFVDPDHPALRTAPLQQLWRQHMLGYSMIKAGLYSEGRFIVLAPALNRPIQEALTLYRTHLRPDGVVPFDVISFESWIGAMRRAGAKEATALWNRYVNYEAVDALI